MKSEDNIRYDAENSGAESADWTFHDARIKLVGYRTPTEFICCRKDLEKYCLRMIQDEANESFRIICIAANGGVIGDAEINSGDLSSCAAYPRKVVEIALLMNAASVFFAHNHPGGTCSPSADDLRGTINLKRILGEIGIRVLDHMIITPGGDTYSMAQHGDVDF